MFDHKGAGALTVAVLAFAAPAAARAATHHDLSGLPPLSGAQHYNLSPASRTVRPVAVLDSTPVDEDYVTAATPISESAHDLQAGTSTTATLDGVTVREAGTNAGGHFSYALRVSRSGPVRVRIEEAGSATSDYEVTADGVAVFHRAPASDQTGTWDGLAGLVHDTFTIPAAVVSHAPLTPNGHARTIRLAFVNAADPGDGARIASVWTIASRGPAGGAFGGTVRDPAAALIRHGATFSSHIFGRPYAIYDFGREVGGQVQMSIENLGAPTKLGLAFSESAEYMTSASDFSEDPVGVATETHYVTVPHGDTRFTDPVIRGGLRYLMVFADEPGTVRIGDLRLHFTPAPTMHDLRAYPGAFLSADPTLNRLWYAGAYTVQTDTIDPTTGRDYPARAGEVRNDATIAQGPTAITDGAKRDRMDWVGDQSVEGPVAFLSTGDTRSALDSFAFMGNGVAADGEVPGIYLPNSGYNDGWGEYAEWWVDEYWQYWLATGDRHFLNRWWPTVQGDLAWLQSLRGSDGLLDVSSASGHWGYGDGGEETYDNALYAYVLHDAAQAASVEGDRTQASTYSSDAQSIDDAIDAHLWDASAGAYVVSTTDDAHPQDGNVMALLSGAATGARAQSVLAFLHTQLTADGPLDIDQPGNVVGQYVSPFVTYYELLAEAAQNSQTSTDEAMTILDRTWDTMLRPGVSGDMWENVSLSGAPQLGAYTSLSHGWSAGVVPFLTDQVLGVQATSGGYATFTALPHPPSDLPWAEGAVPTPAGTITTGWRRAGDTLTEQVQAPAGSTYTVGVPDTASTVSANGTVIWRDGQATAPGVSDVDGYIELAGATGSTTLEATS